MAENKAYPSGVPAAIPMPSSGAQPTQTPEEPIILGGHESSPARRLIQPLGIEGNAMVTLNVYVDIEPMSKIQYMLRVAPALRGKSSRRSRQYSYC